MSSPWRRILLLSASARSARPLGPLLDALRPLASRAAASAGRRPRTAAAPAAARRLPPSATARPRPPLRRFAPGASATAAAAFGAAPPPNPAALAASSAFAAVAFGLAAYETVLAGGPGGSPARAEIKFLPGTTRGGAAPPVVRWTEEEWEREWDDFMVKSVRPGEEEDGDEDEDEEKEKEEEEDIEDDEDQDDEEAPADAVRAEASPHPVASGPEEEYVAACERSVPSENRVFERHFWSTEHELANSNVELDDWMKYIEAKVKDRGGEDDEEEDDDEFEEEEEEEDDEEGRREDAAVPEPEEVPAAVRVRLYDEATGRPVRVAYVRDHNGRLLGVKRFSAEDIPPCERSVGRCPFGLRPGATGSVRVFVIYEGPAEARGHGRTLYYSPPIPIPSVPRRFDKDEDAGDENWVPCA